MLFASALFDTRMFDGGTTIATPYSTDAAVFGNFSLSDGTYMVLTQPPTSGPTRDLIGDIVPRSDGRYQTADYFRETTIELQGYVKHTSKALMATYLDTIRKNLRVPQGNLDLIDDAGVVKRYVATVDNYEEMFKDRQYYHLTLCPFRIRFKCLTPFGQARAYTSSSLTLTTSPTTQSVVNSGTYVAQPVVLLNFDAANSVTAVDLQNQTTGEEITYTGSIAAGDILIFDSELKTVTKNGTAVDFTGGFPTLDVGANLIKITVTGTSFSAYATYKYLTKYL